MPRLLGLRRQRERRLMTVRARRPVGVGPSTIVNLEIHDQEARMSTARRLAAALDCAPDALLGEPDPAGWAAA